MKSYVAAIVASVSVSLAIRRALLPWTAGVTGAKGYVYNSVSSFFAVTASAFLNAWYMRQSEMHKGIAVLDPETQESYGLSKNLAYTAVLQTSLSRIALNFTFFVPPLALYWIEKKRMMP